jgi:hypothetical protein
MTGEWKAIGAGSMWGIAMWEKMRDGGGGEGRPARRASDTRLNKGKVAAGAVKANGGR